MEVKETKKFERLVTAVYMLTSFFDEKEPMKWRLRELGGSLLSSRNVLENVPSILSLLNVAKNAGLVSDMNFEIINREFSLLLPASASLEDLFATQALPEPETGTDPKQEAKTLMAEERAPEAPRIYVSSSVAEARSSKDIKDRHFKEFGIVAVKKNSRQSTIINLLKRKKEIMIKDVSPLIEGVSEKTIQRELLSMVKSGTLKKIGEKRWSRYSLAE